MNFNDIDKIWMQRALSEARKSADFGEVPVGAVITDGSDLLAASGNCPITSVDPTAHAEINVIREAALKQNNYRLPGATLYVTLEPCAMCMGAIIHARIQRLVFGAYDPKTGAAVSRYRLGTDNLLNHALIVQGGVLKDQCSSLLQTFFKQRRS
jgi:tRNA(adenine34) deaminase